MHVTSCACAMLVGYTTYFPHCLCYAPLCSTRACVNLECIVCARLSVHGLTELLVVCLYKTICSSPPPSVACTYKATFYLCMPASPYSIYHPLVHFTIPCLNPATSIMPPHVLAYHTIRTLPATPLPPHYATPDTTMTATVPCGQDDSDAGWSAAAGVFDSALEVYVASRRA